MSCLSFNVAAIGSDVFFQVLEQSEELTRYIRSKGNYIDHSNEDGLVFTIFVNNRTALDTNAAWLVGCENDYCSLIYYPFKSSEAAAKYAKRLREALNFVVASFNHHLSRRVTYNFRMDDIQLLDSFIADGIQENIYYGNIDYDDF